MHFKTVPVKAQRWGTQPYDFMRRFTRAARYTRGVFRLALVLVLVACSRPVAPPIVEAPGITVTKLGAEPRHTLAYHPVKGAHAALELVVEMSLHAGDLGGPPLTMVVQLDTAADDVLADGKIKLRTKVESATLRDPPADLPPDAQHAVDQLAGMAITATLSPDGKIDDPQLDLAGKTMLPNTDEQMRAILDGYQQVAMVLPHVPIGVGAQWKSARTIAQGGMTMTATTTVGLSALEGSHASYAIATEITGADQTVGNDDTAIAVSGIHGSGTGTGSIDLTTLEMSGDLATTVESTMTAQGQAEKMSMSVHRTFKKP